MARALGRSQAILVVQPPPAGVALARDPVDAAVVTALEDGRRSGIRGVAVTPYLLAAVERSTGGTIVTRQSRITGGECRARRDHPPSLSPEAGRRQRPNEDVRPALCTFIPIEVSSPLNLSRSQWYNRTTLTSWRLRYPCPLRS